MWSVWSSPTVLHHVLDGVERDHRRLNGESATSTDENLEGTFISRPFLRRDKSHLVAREFCGTGVRAKGLEQSPSNRNKDCRENDQRYPARAEVNVKECFSGIWVERLTSTPRICQ